MSTIQLSSDTIAVRFTPMEKLAGLVRDISVPLEKVAAVTVVPDGLAAARGIRAPGLGVPGRRKIGTWRGRGRTLVDVRRGQPALRIELVDEHHVVLLIGTDDAEALADRIASDRAVAPAR